MAQYKDIVLEKGRPQIGKITGFGVSYIDTKLNQFDSGIRTVKFGDFDVVGVMDRKNEDSLGVTKTANGFPVRIGTSVQFMVNKDVTNTIPTEQVLMTDSSPPKSPVGYKKTIFNDGDGWSPPTFVKILVGAGIVFGIYKFLKR